MPLLSLFSYDGCRRSRNHFSDGQNHPHLQKLPVKNWGGVRVRSYKNVRFLAVASLNPKRRDVWQHPPLTCGWSGDDFVFPHIKNHPAESAGSMIVPAQGRPKSQYKPVRPERCGSHRGTRPVCSYPPALKGSRADVPGILQGNNPAHCLRR